MRDRDLRRTIQQIVLAGLLAITAGCVEAVIDTDCVDTIDRSFTFQTPADPPLQFDIDKCHVDVGACNELCSEALKRNSVTRMPSRCEVEFRDASVKVDVSYEVFVGGSGCPVEDQPVPFVAPVGLEVSSAAGARPAQAAPIRMKHDGPQVRGRHARTLDSIWNGGRPCHA